MSENSLVSKHNYIVGTISVQLLGLGTILDQSDWTIQLDHDRLGWPKKELVLGSKNYKPLCMSQNQNSKVSLILS